MLSNCPQCGSSLTIKEAVQECCRYCSRRMNRISVLPFARKVRVSRAFLERNFDQLISEELKKGNLLPAA